MLGTFVMSVLLFLSFSFGIYVGTDGNEKVIYKDCTTKQSVIIKDMTFTCEAVKYQNMNIERKTKDQ